jgi:choline dehydrogenase-like flavoprotein
VHYDVVVAGGGTAGCVLAGRLSEDPARTVCLVEAGPDYGPFREGRWPPDILDGRWLALDSHCWARNDEEDRSQLRARILGGCSSHNACVILRAPDADYDEWGPGWTGDELRPYLDRAEQTFGTRKRDAGELSPFIKAFAEASGSNAIVHPVNMTAGGVRWNAAFAWIDPARERDNLTIRADTLVDRVLLDGSRATGVATSAGDIHAETVVVTASAYGSPAILLRSGIKELPVGENLTDHVGTGMGWEATDELRSDWDEWVREHELGMAGVTIEGRSTSCAAGVHDLFLFAAAGPDYDISSAVFAMKPRSRGGVSLTSPDPRAPLAIDHGFLSDEADVEVLVEGLERLREIGATLSRHAGRELRPGQEVSAEEHVRATARGFFHPVGTCAIGAVVDERGRVYGYENLLVADASIMPTIPRVNTNLSTAAIAEKIAETI